jgi:hypothetical protein
MYDILILGHVSEKERKDTEDSLIELLKESGIDYCNVSILYSPENYLDDWSPKKPTVVACFQKLNKSDVAIIEKLVEERVPTIPVKRIDEAFEDFIDTLRPLNGIAIEGKELDYSALSTVLLECLGLLRQQRRVFISYKREESREVAIQLHDFLSSKGFNVFLDTHSIRPGKVFQESLWHDLSDSDVVIMLDTPKYFESRWTREEFGRALSMGIHLLRIVWPKHTPMRETELSESIYLGINDIQENQLTKQILEQVSLDSEKLRARSIAARHIDITGKLLAEVEGVGGVIIGAGAYRTIAVELKDKTKTWVYPVVGVPTAPVMNQIAKWAESANHEKPFIVYDHQGIADLWLEHMDWLNARVPEVDFLRVSEAGKELKKRECA